MKGLGSVMGVLAVIVVVVAILARLMGKAPLGISTRGMFDLAAVILLFGINSSLCSKGE